MKITRTLLNSGRSKFPIDGSTKREYLSASRQGEDTAPIAPRFDLKPVYTMKKPVITPRFPKIGAFFHAHGLKDRHKLIKTFQRFGLTQVQIGDPLLSELVANPRKAAEVRKDFENAGIAIAGLAGYRNLVAPDPAKRKCYVQFLKTCLELAPAMGTTVVATETGTLNPATDWEPHPENSSTGAWTLMLDVIAELLDVAAKNGTRLALEGYVNNMVGRLDQVERVLRSFPDGNLALILDPYNYITRDLIPTADLVAQEFFDRYADLFVIAHLKDVAPLGADGTAEENGGRADLTGTPEFCTGIFPQQVYMRFLRDRRPDLPIIVEHLPYDNIPEAFRRFRALAGLPV